MVGFLTMLAEAANGSSANETNGTKTNATLSYVNGQFCQRGNSALYRHIVHCGFFCAVLATIISLIHISRHVRLAAKGDIKRCVLRILMMVPIFSLATAVSLQLEIGEDTDNFQIPFFLTTLRDLYESLVLASFVQFLLVFLGRPDGTDFLQTVPLKPTRNLAELLSQTTPTHPRLGCLGFDRVKVPYTRGLDFVAYVLVGILQYSVVMVLVASINVVVFVASGDPETNLFAWLADKLKACSCGFAMYNLGLLYVNIEKCKKARDKLDPINPENKFLCVKLIIFFTFYQKFVLNAMQSWGWMHAVAVRSCVTDSQYKSTLEDLLLCVEMLVFSFWHLNAYQAKEFNVLEARAGLGSSLTWCRAMDRVHDTISAPAIRLLAELDAVQEFASSAQCIDKLAEIHKTMDEVNTSLLELEAEQHSRTSSHLPGGAEVAISSKGVQALMREEFHATVGRRQRMEINHEREALGEVRRSLDLVEQHVEDANNKAAKDHVDRCKASVKHAREALYNCLKSGPKAVKFALRNALAAKVTSFELEVGPHEMYFRAPDGNAFSFNTEKRDSVGKWAGVPDVEIFGPATLGAWCPQKILIQDAFLSEAMKRVEKEGKDFEIDKQYLRDKPTWKEWSGRFVGDDSYQFGDICKGLFSANGQVGIMGLLAMRKEIMEVFEAASAIRKAALMITLHPRIWGFVGRIFPGGKDASRAVSQVKANLEDQAKDGNISAKELKRLLENWRLTDGEAAKLVQAEGEREDARISTDAIFEAYKKDHETDVKKIFEQLPKANGQSLSENELKGILAKLPGNLVASKNIRQEFKQADKDGNGLMDANEFVAWYEVLLEKETGQQNQSRSTEEEEKARIAQAFTTIDRDQDGCLTRQEMRFIMLAAKQDKRETWKDYLFYAADADESTEADNKRIDGVITEMDRNSDGEITFDEFEHFFMQRAGSREQEPSDAMTASTPLLQDQSGAQPARLAEPVQPNVQLEEIFSRFDMATRQPGAISAQEVEAQIQRNPEIGAFACASLLNSMRSSHSAGRDATIEDLAEFLKARKNGAT